MQRSPAPSRETPPRRSPVTRSAARADESGRFIERAARAAADELPSLADTTDAPELALMQRALDACIALCAADAGSDEHYAAIAQVWAVAEEAQR